MPQWIAMGERRSRPPAKCVNSGERQGRGPEAVRAPASEVQLCRYQDTVCLPWLQRADFVLRSGGASGQGAETQHPQMRARAEAETAQPD